MTALQGLPLAVANLRCVLEAAHAGGWVAWRDLAAQMTVDDRVALAEFSSALMVVPPANLPDADTLKDFFEDQNAGFFYFGRGGTAVGVDGRSAAFLQTAASTPGSTTPGDGTPWGLTPEMVRRGNARMEAESAAISAAQTPGVTFEIDAEGRRRRAPRGAEQRPTRPSSPPSRSTVNLAAFTPGSVAATDEVLMRQVFPPIREPESAEETRRGLPPLTASPVTWVPAPPVMGPLPPEVTTPASTTGSTSTAQPTSSTPTPARTTTPRRRSVDPADRRTPDRVASPSPGPTRRSGTVGIRSRLSEAEVAEIRRNLTPDYGRYKERMHRRGAVAEDPPPQAIRHLARQTVEEVIQMEEAAAAGDESAVPKIPPVSAPTFCGYWFCRRLPEGYLGARIPYERQKERRRVAGWCTHPCTAPGCQYVAECRLLTHAGVGRWGRRTPEPAERPIDDNIAELQANAVEAHFAALVADQTLPPAMFCDLGRRLCRFQAPAAWRQKSLLKPRRSRLVSSPVVLSLFVGRRRCCLCPGVAAVFALARGCPRRRRLGRTSMAWVPVTTTAGANFGDFLKVVAEAGGTAHLTTFARLGVTNTPAVRESFPVLLDHGVPETVLLAILAPVPPQQPAPLVSQTRTDVPERRSSTRASMTAAIDSNLLAQSTRRSMESRVRMLTTLAEKGNFQLFPLDAQKLQLLAGTAAEPMAAPGVPAVDFSAELPAIDFVPAPISAERALVPADTATHYVMNCRTRLLHKPAAEESSTERAEWQARCGWPYGVRQFYRLHDLPPNPSMCRRCFPETPVDLDTPEAVSSSDSSSAAAVVAEPRHSFDVSTDGGNAATITTEAQKRTPAAMAAAPTVASQMVQLSELFNAAGAGDGIRQYLAAKKISATPTLALIAKNAEDLITTMVIAPFLAGVTIDGTDHKVEAGEEPVATAIMMHLFVEARRQWDTFSQAPTAPPAQPAASAAAQPPAGHSPPGSATPGHIPDRPPKTFAAWTQQVKAYEDRLLDGKRRTFPVQELLGAEEVLARMWFEHTVTKMYTPITLGEILCRPNAARWAWILVGIGEEDDVMKYADWFVAKARAHADMVPAIQAFWHKSAWTIAMALRNSTSFGEAVTGVMNDVATWQEVLAQEAPDFAARRGNRRKRRRPGKPKGKGRDGKDQDPPKKTDAAHQQVIVLSALDGVGAAPWLVWDLIGEPRAIFSWEVDRAAIQVADYHIPGIRHRGDITEDTPEDLAAEIQHIDGKAECIIIFTAAPPCYLFNFTAEFMDELRRRLAPRRFGFLVENVEMTQADAAEASKQLGCQPVFADAADFGWIGRPRLWWSSVDWDEVTHDPSTAERWTWVLHRRWDRLRLDSPRAAPDSFDLDGLRFSDAVASGRIRLPCSTTPAADERGRPPPRSMRGKVTTDVQQRWLQDSRQFAPWHYQRDAMLADDQGKLVVLTPGAKEQLHHMPKDFTAKTPQGELEPRTRHRLLGNGWHWGVARRFLLAVLVHAAASLPTAAAIPATPPRPAPAKPSLAALQELDEDAHWRASWALKHPLATPPPLEPAWELLLELRRRHDLVRIRREVVAEVHLLIDDLDEESRTWMAARSSWVRATYSTPDKPAPTRVLAFLELLRRLNYPDLTALTEDMTDGFQMLGEIRPGPGWRRREDGKYQNPVPIADLIATNADYVRRKDEDLGESAADGFQDLFAALGFLTKTSKIIAFAAFAKMMPPTIVAFIDNTAGQAALTKGYGKDTAVNGMISAFWTLAARRGWFVEFERVPSKASVADALLSLRLK
ncbi:eIF3-S7, partial [Symbiodinium necroappetens]